MTQPTITSNVICQVSPPPSQGPPWGVSYTCNDPGNIVFWTGSFFPGEETVSTSSGNINFNDGDSGVNIMESHTNDTTCINSTLILTGNNLTVLNGATLNCRGTGGTDMITIIIPSKNLLIRFSYENEQFGAVYTKD